MTDFRFEYHGTRQCCTVCGGVTEKFEVLASTEKGGGKIIVCGQCLSDGQDQIDANLARRADEVEKRALEHARFLRSLIGELHDVPTHAQWQAELEYHDACYGTDLTREQWGRWTPEQRQHWTERGADAWRNGDPVAMALVPKIKREPPPYVSGEMPW
jgi:hypothetical protein